LEQIQCSADAAKEVWLGMEGYLEVVRACNEEHKQMRQHNASQEVSLEMGELEVHAIAQTSVWSSDWRLPDD